MFYLKWKRELGEPSLFWDLRGWVLNLSEAWPFPDLARAIDQWCEHGFEQIALVDAAGDEFYYRDRIMSQSDKSVSMSPHVQGGDV